MGLHKLGVVLALMTAAGYILAAPADSSQRSANDSVVVEVNGVQVTLADLEKKRAAALFQARTNYYDAERKVIEDVVGQLLLEQQAAKEGISVSELLDRHVNKAVDKDPSEEALRVYYEGVDTTEPYEAVRPKIIDALRQRRIAKAKAAYLQSLQSQMSIVIRLAPPRTPISMNDVPLRGASGARVTLVEFADFQCPMCQQIQPVLEKIEAEFKGKIAFGYKDFPLSMHPDAPKAAEAAHCAGAQGKYWEYHDLMFARKQLDQGALRSYASQLKLDTAAFANCLDTGQMVGIVKGQATEAESLGFPGTPTLLVNGRFISGSLTYDKLRAVITEELSSLEANMAAPKAAAASSPDHDKARIP